MYQSINNKEFSKAQAINKSLLSDSLPRIRNEFVEKEIIRLATKHLNSPVSTYYIFSELYKKRNFNEYYTTFKHLNGKALNSPYYQMIKNQYEKKN